MVGAVLTGQLSIGWSNDLLDLPRDIRTASLRQAAGDRRAVARLVRAACAVAVVACVGLSLALGWAAGLVHLLGVACGWAYNLGLKATAWSWLPYAVAFGSLAAVPSLAAGDPVPAWLPLSGALLGTGRPPGQRAARPRRRRRHRGLGVPAPLADGWVARTSRRSRPFVRRRDRPAAGRGAVGCSTWVGGAVVAVLASLTVLGHGRTPFRAAMAIALVDVVLLALTVRPG